MRKCYGTSSLSILLNGSSVEYFHGSMGLRQGDSLFPFLFLIVVEAFGALLIKVYQGGLLEGFQVRDNGVMVTHLQFADDTLIICKDSATQIRYLQCLIRCFEAVYGFKVNLSKSSMFGVGAVENIDALAANLGCRVDTLPTTYLALPLGAPYKNKAIWDKVIERMHTRLAGWKGMLLSKRGKLTLIKSELANLPTYYLSLFVVPASVTKIMERYQCDFLWEKGKEGDDIHLVAWEDVCKPKRNGGLGF